jgi:hypothetical protein
MHMHVFYAFICGEELVVKVVVNLVVSIAILGQP